MASSPKSHNELMKQDVPIKFDAIFSPNCLVYCHYEYKRSIAMFDITWLDKVLHRFFCKNTVYKNIQAQNSWKLRIF